MCAFELTALGTDTLRCAADPAASSERGMAPAGPSTEGATICYSNCPKRTGLLPLLRHERACGYQRTLQRAPVQFRVLIARSDCFPAHPRPIFLCHVLSSWVPTLRVVANDGSVTQASEQAVLRPSLLRAAAAPFMAISTHGGRHAPALSLQCWQAQPSSDADAQQTISFVNLQPAANRTQWMIIGSSGDWIKQRSFRVSFVLARAACGNFRVEPRIGGCASFGIGKIKVTAEKAGGALLFRLHRSCSARARATAAACGHCCRLKEASKPVAAWSSFGASILQ